MAIPGYPSYMIVGIDEVGRGCWAGPVIAGAVMLRAPIPGLKDSKQLTRSERERLDADIKSVALAWSVGQAEPEEIDTYGMTAAITLAMERALASIGTKYREVIIDGSYNFLRSYPLVRSLTKADLFIPAVSAASIIAKVTRDRYMAQISTSFPLYGFERHVGYGTALHRAAIQEHGLTYLHRKSFRPVQAFLGYDEL